MIYRSGQVCCSISVLFDLILMTRSSTRSAYMNRVRKNDESGWRSLTLFFNFSTTKKNGGMCSLKTLKALRQAELTRWPPDIHQKKKNWLEFFPSWAIELIQVSLCGVSCPISAFFSTYWIIYYRLYYKPGPGPLSSLSQQTNKAHGLIETADLFFFSFSLVFVSFLVFPYCVIVTGIQSLSLYCSIFFCALRWDADVCIVSSLVAHDYRPKEMRKKGGELFVTRTRNWFITW